VQDCDLKELAMPDLDQIKQAEQGARDRRGRFGRGRSGNPEGRAAAATTSTALPGYLEWLTLNGLTMGDGRAE
jgi:hypothetical protein